MAGSEGNLFQTLVNQTRCNQKCFDRAPVGMAVELNLYEFKGNNPARDSSMWPASRPAIRAVSSTDSPAASEVPTGFEAGRAGSKARIRKKRERRCRVGPHTRHGCRSASRRDLRPGPVRRWQYPAILRPISPRLSPAWLCTPWRFSRLARHQAIAKPPNSAASRRRLGRLPCERVTDISAATSTSR